MRRRGALTRPGTRTPRPGPAPTPAAQAAPRPRHPEITGGPRPLRAAGPAPTLEAWAP